MKEEKEGFKISIELSKEQREILRLLIEKNFSPREIAKKRNTSLQAVYKSINKLKKRGFVPKGRINPIKRINIIFKAKKLARFKKCLFCGYNKIVHIHHIIQRVNELTNLIPLCPNCHNEIHKFGYTDDKVKHIINFASIGILESIKKYNEKVQNIQKGSK